MAASFRASLVYPLDPGTVVTDEAVQGLIGRPVNLKMNVVVGDGEPDQHRMFGTIVNAAYVRDTNEMHLDMDVETAYPTGDPGTKVSVG